MLAGAPALARPVLHDAMAMRVILQKRIDIGKVEVKHVKL